MSLVDNIDEVMKKRGLNFKRLERECGLGNGTIKRWDHQSPRLDGLIKVSKYLHTSLDALVFGSRESETVCDGAPLDESEMDLIAMYRFIAAPDRKTVFDIAKMKYDQATGEKESIYSTYSDTKGQQKSDPDDGKSADGIA